MKTFFYVVKNSFFLNLFRNRSCLLLKIVIPYLPTPIVRAKVERAQKLLLKKECLRMQR